MPQPKNITIWVWLSDPVLRTCRNHYIYDIIMTVLVGPSSDTISSDGMQTSRMRHDSIRGHEFDPRIEAWLRTHTVGDLKILAREMESKGENVHGIHEVLHALDLIEKGQLPRMGGG
jgi:hypothetical protein